MISFHILPNRPNLSKKQFLAKIDFPHLYFEGNYDMTVNVLFIKYKGKGVIAGNFSEYWVTRCFIYHFKDVSERFYTTLKLWR